MYNNALCWKCPNLLSQLNIDLTLKCHLLHLQWIQTIFCTTWINGQTLLFFKQYFESFFQAIVQHSKDFDKFRNIQNFSDQLCAHVAFIGYLPFPFNRNIVSIFNSDSWRYWFIKLLKELLITCHMICTATINQPAITWDIWGKTRYNKQLFYPLLDSNLCLFLLVSILLPIDDLSMPPILTLYTCHVEFPPAFVMRMISLTIMLTRWMLSLFVVVCIGVAFICSILWVSSIPPEFNCNLACKASSIVPSCLIILLCS